MDMSQFFTYHRYVTGYFQPLTPVLFILIVFTQYLKAAGSQRYLNSMEELPYSQFSPLSFLSMHIQGHDCYIANKIVDGPLPISLS